MSLHSHIFTSGHSQFISLSLWQHHGGCRTLPLGEVKMRCYERGRSDWECAVERCPIPQWCLSFRDSEVAKECHAEGGESGDTNVNQLSGRGSTSIHNSPNLTHSSDAPSPKERKRVVIKKGNKRSHILWLKQVQEKTETMLSSHPINKHRSTVPNEKSKHTMQRLWSQ